MNERIRELAEQAFQPINDISTEGVADRYTFEQAWFQMYNQKFAELIVKECAKVLTQHGAYYSGDGEPYHYAASLIEEHFGVQQ